ncbi:MAG: hypothetical protein G01um101429_821 [Parcubacteria group bacterium Gr01-1014_29]|nr:MAG: hypothetical protein G01um101429_821 [Parcubacteria group bacterium Gr01-1014_29]
MRDHLKNLRVAFEEVFSYFSYIALASALAILAFLFAVWLPNIGLLAEVFGVSSTPLETKLKLAWSLLGGIRTNFSLLSAGYTIAIAALFGVNIAMVAYFLKRTRLRQSYGGQARSILAGQDVAAGLGGITSGVFGIGCAACGSFILSAVLSSLGAAGALAILPLRGGEFGILSVALLAFSLVLISKKIAAPLTCNTKPL